MKRFFVLVLILLLASASTVFAAPKVVVSIKPIHALVAGIMEGAATPELLLKGTATPHGFSLKPSQVRALSQADMIIYVNHGLESFLVKPLKTVAGKAKVIEVADLPGIKLIAGREGGTWEGHRHEEHDHGHKDHGHEEEGHGEEEGHEVADEEIDPHLWLDPENAATLVLDLAGELSGMDPENAALYQQNAAKLIKKIGRQQRELTKKLAPIRTVPYLVFHDAYHYFEAAFDLNAVGSVTLNPERKPGARRLQQIRQKIKTLQVRAIFTEPQFEPRLVNAVSEGADLRIGTLDPLGSEIPAGKEAWFALMDALAEELSRTLK